MGQKIKSKQNKLVLDYLHQTQKKNGFISEDNIRKIAKKTSYSEAEIYDTASFYADFNLEKPALKTIKMCQSPVCHMKGSENLLNYISELLKIKIGDQNKKVNLETCQCLGLCDQAPVMLINDQEYTKLTKDKIKEIFKKEKII
ncbi:NAD(P)H-dependent oxidoreductase subunit E [bacterium]|nr:NAD(P)H-dependent oxidoreductase subunit E [bacterium]